MAVRVSTNARNTQLSGLRTAFAGGSIVIYTGTQPASANTAASGTLLATITLPSPAFAEPAAGAMAKTGTWSATASGTGTAGYARLVDIGGDVRIDLAVGAEVTMAEADVISGGTVTVNTCTITAPSGE